MAKGKAVSGQRPKTSTSQHLNGPKQAPGRHSCSCQARIHRLVSNCLGCGKIVCKQEGSGPCFFCGTLVCNEEEREILNRKSRKSAELYKQLTGREMPVEEDGPTLAGIASNMSKALTFRNTLLEADADSERRTHVNDLESDFANVDKNIYLSKEERDAIIRRRDELRVIREKRKKALVVDINLGTGKATEKKANLTETDAAYDPVIRQILERSDDRRRLAEFEQSQRLDASEAHWRPVGYVPKYTATDSVESQRADIVEEHDVVCLGRQSEEAAALEVERRGYAFAIPQPTATLVANGHIKYLRWSEDPLLVGPLFVCSTATSALDRNSLKQQIDTKMWSSTLESLDFSPGSVLGRVYLQEVLTIAEYTDDVGVSSSLEGEGGYVLHFSFCEPLISSIPHIPPSSWTIYQLEPALRKALIQVFSG